MNHCDPAAFSVVYCASRINCWRSMALLGEDVMSLAVNSCWRRTVRATSVRINGAGIVVVEGVVKWAERAATRVVLPVH